MERTMEKSFRADKLQLGQRRVHDFKHANRPHQRLKLCEIALKLRGREQAFIHEGEADERRGWPCVVHNGDRQKRQEGMEPLMGAIQK